MEDLLRLTLSRLGFSNFLLLLDCNPARPCCVALVLAIEEAVQLPGLTTEPPSTEASSSSASQSWWSIRSLLHARRLWAMMVALSIIGPFIVSIGVMDWPDMPGMKSSSKALGHFRKPICYLPSLAKIIIGPDVLIHLLKELLQGLWGLPSKILGCRSWAKPLDHGLNENFIGHCKCLCSQTQKPSDIRLKVLLRVLHALKQSLSSDWLRLKALETSD
jgi:hypothetical protein